MGNTCPRIAMRDIHLTPGNVLIEVQGPSGTRTKAWSKDRGEYTEWHNLIRGTVIKSGPSIMMLAAIPHAHPPGFAGYPQLPAPIPGASSAAPVGPFEKGEEVWVRSSKGYPVEIEDGRKLFIVNEWDVAIRVRDRAAAGGGDGDEPPPYPYGTDEKPHPLDCNHCQWNDKS